MFRKQKQMLLTAGIFILASIALSAQEPVKLSLQEAVQLALKNNTNIMNSELDLKSAKKRVWETIATGLPHVDASGTYTHIFKVPTLSFPSADLSYDKPEGVENPGGVDLGNGQHLYLVNKPGPSIELGVKNNITYDFTLSQLIFSGSYLVGLQASKVYYGYTEQTAEKTRQDVIETVINTYNMIKLAEESRKILSQNLENINKTLYEVSEMNKHGLVAKTDAEQLEITGKTFKNALNQIESNLDMVTAFSRYRWAWKMLPGWN